MADASGDAAPIVSAAGASEAGGAAPRERRAGGVLAVLTWVMVGLNALALFMLIVPGAAMVELQEQVSQQFEDAPSPTGAGALYWIGVLGISAALNALAVWRRRDWGLAIAVLAAVGCWIVWGVALEVAQS